MEKERKLVYDFDIFYDDFQSDVDEGAFCKDVNEYKKKQKNLNDNPKFLVLFNRKMLSNDRFLSFVDKKYKHLVELGLNPKELVFSVYNNFKKKTFSQEELDKLNLLDNRFKEKKSEFGIFDYVGVFNSKQVKNANDQIKQMAYEIKKHHYSPLEKLMKAYMEISKREYKSSKIDPTIARSVYGVLNSDKIVCAGYSELIKAVIKEIGDENIKIFANEIAYEDVDKNGEKYISYHQNNIVYIHDEKYGIKGFYCMDPTFGSWQKNGHKSELGMMFLLNEISQLDCFEKTMGKTLTWKEGIKRDKNEDGEFTNKDLLQGAYSSVALNSADIFSEISLNCEYTDEFDDDLLSKFLLKNKDFQEWMALKKTMTDCQGLRIDFDDLFSHNKVMAEKYSKKMSELMDQESQFDFLNENSPHIDIGKIQRVIQTVYKGIMKGKSKDEISKQTYQTLKQNIADAKKYFSTKDNTFGECELLK